MSWAPDELGVLEQACPAFCKAPWTKLLGGGEEVDGEVKRPNNQVDAPILC